MEADDSKLLQFAVKEVNRGIQRGDYSKHNESQMEEALTQAFDVAVEQSRDLTPEDHRWFERAMERWQPTRRKMMGKVRRSNLRRWGRGFQLYSDCVIASEVMNHMLEDCIGAWIRSDESAVNEALLGVDGVMGGRGLKCLTMLSLQSRACSISNEIALLAEHGYPEAVKARTRSLHELAVTARALSGLGLTDTTVSDRYGAWTVAEARKESRARSMMGFTPDPLPEDDAALEQRAKDSWGNDFFKQNGWASPLFPGRRPPIPFSDLEKLVSMDHMRTFYLAGNDAIHAGPSALNSRARFRNGAIFHTSSEVQHETTRHFLAAAAITLSEICNATCRVIAYITQDFDATFAVKAVRDAVELARLEFKADGMRPPS
ncbi:DUF5677 domain-containing protein [Streptomyces lydicus]|uniref:DUF5677 domain-containing protein n=1 Tax=Streptomyces lydicus TaxID=47763 RepID=UPI00379AFA64